MKMPATALGLLLFVVATPWLRSQKTDSAPANGAPVVMEPFSVEEIRINLTLRVFFRETPDGPRVASLRIDDVRKKSAAERVGLVAGLEVLAINGVNVVGLDQAALDKLWRGPFHEPFFVLRVAPMPLHSGFVTAAYDVTVPLKQPPPEPPLYTFTIQSGPKELTPPAPEPKPEASATPSPARETEGKPTAVPAPMPEKPPSPAPAPKAEQPPSAQGEVRFCAAHCGRLDHFTA
jgi:hypothetical protein